MGEDYMHHTKVLAGTSLKGNKPEDDGHVEVRHASELFRAKPLSSMYSDRCWGCGAVIGGKKDTSTVTSPHHPIT